MLGIEYKPPVLGAKSKLRAQRGSESDPVELEVFVTDLASRSQVDVATGTVTRVSPSGEGSYVLLSAGNGVALAAASTAVAPPRLVAAATGACPPQPG
eukprot:2094696-Pyramimonas_sp.AAC.1